jgi:hypothetical protein
LIIDAGSRWRVVEFKPGHSPLHNLARCLLQSQPQGAEPDPAPGDIESLRARLARRPAELIEWSREHLTERENLLLVVDQFEELFRYQAAGSQEEAEAFVALLLDSAQAWDDPLYVAITMRSEYLGPCALIEGLAETISAGMFLVPRMTRISVKPQSKDPPKFTAARSTPRSWSDSLTISQDCRHGRMAVVTLISSIVWRAARTSFPCCSTRSIGCGWQRASSATEPSG